MHCWYQNRECFQFFLRKLEGRALLRFPGAGKSNIFFFFNHRGGIRLFLKVRPLLPFSHYMAKACSEDSALESVSVSFISLPDGSI